MSIVMNPRGLEACRPLDDDFPGPNRVRAIPTGDRFLLAPNPTSCTGTPRPEGEIEDPAQRGSIPVGLAIHSLSPGRIFAQAPLALQGVGAQPTSWPGGEVLLAQFPLGSDIDPRGLGARGQDDEAS